MVLTCSSEESSNTSQAPLLPLATKSLLKFRDKAYALRLVQSGDALSTLTRSNVHYLHCRAAWTGRRVIRSCSGESSPIIR